MPNAGQHSAEISVLIVGAGPTGLTLACDLARRGVKLRIVDKAAAYFAGSRGKGLQPRSLEVLDDLGIVDEILANGRFHLPFRGYDGATVLGDKDMHEGRHPTPDVPYASPLIIPQWRVEEILRKRLAAFGSKVELATELIDLAQNEEVVTATLLCNGLTRKVTTLYVLAADGGRSFLRKHLNVGFDGESWKDERMLVGDVQVDVLDRDHWHSWPKHQDGWVALCPLPSTNAFQFQAQISPQEPDEPSLERVQQIIDARTGRSDIRLHDATWLSLYRANVRMVDRYRVGRVFLAGDAAHVHSPAGGQGMNTGMQDAYNLGWKLSAVLAGASDSLLDTYEEERLPIAAWLLGATTQLHRQTFRENATLQRDQQFLQLALNYRGSSLAQGEPSLSTTLQPGDRAPDAPLRDHLGKEMRLFDLFRSPHFTLLEFTSQAPRENENATNTQPFAPRYKILRSPVVPSRKDEFASPDEHSWKSYGPASDALFLIRPDGYIAFIGHPESAPQVKDYLRRFAPINDAKMPSTPLLEDHLL
ncbi:MAG TPA: FAD-dependent oxidoreductase [Acidobacteriaceae bacterium]|nr:FAD-dependent oxidoreductase [Acidobacteriaceae bacterium]